MRTDAHIAAGTTHTQRPSMMKCSERRSAVLAARQSTKRPRLHQRPSFVSAVSCRSLRSLRSQPTSLPANLPCPSISTSSTMSINTSRLSSFALDFVPASAAVGYSHLPEFRKFGNNVADSTSPDLAFNSRYQPSPNYSLMLSGRNMVAPGFSCNRSYSPYGFTTSSNSVQSNSPDTSFVRPFSSQAASSLYHADSMDGFSNFAPADLESIWKDVEVANCDSQFRNFSLGSNKNNSSDSKDDYLNLGINNQRIQFRKIVGRDSSYYDNYGKECLPVPINAVINYSLDRKVEYPFKSGKTNQRRKDSKKECAFCKNMGDSENYKTHWLKNTMNVVTCPVLRAYTCPLCKNPGGDNAHTIRYCPQKRQQLAEDFKRAKNEATNTIPVQDRPNHVFSPSLFLTDDAFFGSF